MSRMEVSKSEPNGNKELPVILRLSEPAVIKEIVNLSDYNLAKKGRREIDPFKPNEFVYETNHASLVESNAFSLSNSRLCSSSHQHNTVFLNYSSQCANTTVPLMKPTLPANWIRFCPAEEWTPEMHVVNCMSPDCGASFNIFTRKYHCKMCGRVFCASCCSNEITVEIPYCPNESNVAVRESTNTKIELKRSHWVASIEDNINGINNNNICRELRSQTTYSELHNSVPVCEENKEKESRETKSYILKDENTAHSLEHKFAQRCEENAFNKLEKQEQFHNQLSNNVQSKMVIDNFSRIAINNDKVEDEMQQLIKLPEWTHDEPTRLLELHDECKVANKVIDVPSISNSYYESNLVTPAESKFEKPMLEKANTKNDALDFTSNVPAQQDRQSEENTKLITVYVCRTCYYETQLVISKRQANGELRRKSRGEFKMFQRALLVNILSFLTLSDLAEVALVASDFYFMAKDNVIWYQYNVRRWTLDTEQSQLEQESTLSHTSASSSLMRSGNPVQYRSLNYLNPFATLQTQPLLGQTLSSASTSSYAVLSSPEQRKSRAQGNPSSPLLNYPSSASSFTQRGRYPASSLSASNLEEALMEDATALTVNEAARRVISLHSRYNFTQFLDFTRRQEMARCGGLAAFGVGYRILFSNPIKIAFLGPQHIGKTTCIRAFFDEDIATSVVTHSTMGFTRFVRSIRLLGSTIAEVPVHIYDLSGDERYEELWKLICRHCHVIALCYDASRKVTLIEAANIMLSVEQVLGPQPVITCGLIPDTHLPSETKYSEQMQRRHLVQPQLLHKNHTVPANYVGTAAALNLDEGKPCHNHKVNAINNTLSSTSASMNNNNNNTCSIKERENKESRANSHVVRPVIVKTTLSQKQIADDNYAKNDNVKLKRSLSYSSLLSLKQKQACEQRQYLTETCVNQEESILNEQNILDVNNRTGKENTQNYNNNSNNKKKNDQYNKLFISTVAGQTQTPPTISLGVLRHPLSAPSTPTHGAKHLIWSHVEPCSLVANGKSENGNRSTNHESNYSNEEKLTRNVKDLNEEQANKMEQPEASSMTISEVCYHEELPIPLDINRNNKKKKYNDQEREKLNRASKETLEMSETSQPSSLSSSSSSSTSTSTSSSLATTVKVSHSESNMKKRNGEQKSIKATENLKEHCENNNIHNINSNDDVSVHEEPRLEVSAEDSAEITVRGAGSVQCPVHDASVLFTHLLQCLVDQIAAATMATTATIADISEDVIGGESVHAENDKHLSTPPYTHLSATSSTAHSLTHSPEHKELSVKEEEHNTKTNQLENNKQVTREKQGSHIKYSTTYANTLHKTHRQSARKGNGKRYKVRQAVLQELLNISTQPSLLDVLLDFK